MVENGLGKKWVGDEEGILLVMKETSMKVCTRRIKSCFVDHSGFPSPYRGDATIVVYFGE